MRKAIMTFAYAVVLVVLGVVGFAASEQGKLLALVPAFFGVVVFGLGVGMLVRPLRVHATYVAAIAALGAFGTGVPGLGRAVTWTFAPDDPDPAAMVAWGVMAVVSMVYIVLVLRGFVLPSEERPEEEEG